MFHVRLIGFYDGDIGSWLGLGYLSTALRQNKEVAVSAAYYRIDDVETACIETEEAKPDLIGLSVFQWNLESVKAFSSRIRIALPDVYLTLGGREVTVQPDRMMEWCPEVDSVVIGEGEHTIVELVSMLIEGKSLSNCKGLFFRSSGNIVKNQLRDIEEDIEVYGFPDRSILPPVRDGVSNAFTVITNRGCKGHCSFCDGRRPDLVRSRSMEHVFEEIQQLVDTYNASTIVFQDNSFEDGGSGTIGRFKELSEFIKATNTRFRFFLSVRAETIDDKSASVLEELLDIGLDGVQIGLEAGNQADLDLYRKRAGLAENETAVRLLRNKHIPIYAGFIMFNPYTTFERLRQNLLYLSRFGLLLTPGMLGSRLALTSGASITKKVAKDGLLLPGTIFPITDYFCYEFANERVAQAWLAFRELEHWPNSRLEMFNYQSLRNYLNRSDFRENERVKNFGASIDTYEAETNALLSQLGERIIMLAESGMKSIATHLQCEFSITRDVLERHHRDLEQAEMAIVLMLKRAGQLPIR